MMIDEVLVPQRILPVVALDDVHSAAALGAALLAGGLTTVEITFRTPAALGAIEAMAASGDLLVGAGTVTSAEQATQAVEAGARFIVGPGFSHGVAQRCTELKVRYLPGVVTPTEIMAAVAAGWHQLKFFPASSAGGVDALKALSGPFGEVAFVPTGGISASNLRDYLSLPNVLAVGGSWMVSRALINSAQFDQISALSSEAVALAQEVQVPA